MRIMTTGESHGKGLTAVIEGLPSNLPINEEAINHYLSLRQGGYGRGGRMKIETDRVEFLSGIRGGFTTGAPITLWIPNKDYENWVSYMNATAIEPGREVTKPRPGHADLYGALKYDHKDIRNVLERASARETAARVAIGGVGIQLLEQLGISTLSHVIALGDVKAEADYQEAGFLEKVTSSPVRCADETASQAMMTAIDKAQETGDSLGGIVEVVIKQVVPGVGSYVQWDEKLDAKLAYALMSIQAVKGVSFGMGFDAATSPGSAVHDEIFYDETKGFYKKTNRAGGIEGGMSNGEDIVIRIAFKPIPTLYQPLKTADLITKEPLTAAIERSDTCAIPAASIVAECVAATALCQVLCHQFGTGCLEDMIARYQQFQHRMKE